MSHIVPQKHALCPTFALLGSARSSWSWGFSGSTSSVQETSQNRHNGQMAWLTRTYTLAKQPHLKTISSLCTVASEPTAHKQLTWVHMLIHGYSLMPSTSQRNNHEQSSIIKVTTYIIYISYIIHCFFTASRKWSYWAHCQRWLFGVLMIKLWSSCQ